MLTRDNLRSFDQSVHSATQSTCLDCSSERTHERARIGRKSRGPDGLHIT